MKNKKKSIDELVLEHETRNASLRAIFLKNNVDLGEPRMIECHFWTWSREDTVKLAEAIKNRGFGILTIGSAAIANDPNRWNLEASIKQSIKLTMRREFIADLVELADSYHGLFDGWGTQI